MHILIISQIFPPDMGGSSTRAFNIAKALTLNGVKVTVVAGFPHYPHGNVPEKLRRRALSTENRGDLRIVRTYVPPIQSRGLANRMILFITFLISSLFPLLIVRNIDIVYASNPQVLVIIPALIYSAVHRCPVVLNVDDLWPEDPADIGAIRSGFMRRFVKALAKMAYALADAITPISPGYTKVIRENYGIPESKIHVVRGGVDPNTFKPMPNKNHAKFTVLYSGAFSIAYDFDQVLKAAKLLEKYDDVEIVLQGGGELLNHIKNRMTQMNIKNVRIMDRILNREEVAELLSEADALLLPLRDFGRPYLGMSSKLYEYQAAGRPIICIAEGQPAEYVRETNSGMVVKPGDYEGLAKAVLFLKQNPDVARKMGLSGRRYVEDNLSVEKIGLKVKKLFATLT